MTTMSSFLLPPRFHRPILRAYPYASPPMPPAELRRVVAIGTVQPPPPPLLRDSFGQADSSKSPPRVALSCRNYWGGGHGFPKAPAPRPLGDQTTWCMCHLSQERQRPRLAPMQGAERVGTSPTGCRSDLHFSTRTASAGSRGGASDPQIWCAEV